MNANLGTSRAGLAAWWSGCVRLKAARARLALAAAGADGVAQIDAALRDERGGTGLPCGVVHEWFAQGEPDARTGPAAADDPDPPREGSPSAQPRGWAVWVGKSVWPYPPALAEGRGGGAAGSSDRCGSTRRMRRAGCGRSMRAGCAAVAAIVADGPRVQHGRDAPASARRGAQPGVLSWPGRRRELATLSAAAARWKVRPCPAPVTGRDGTCDGCAARQCSP